MTAHFEVLDSTDARHVRNPVRLWNVRQRSDKSLAESNRLKTQYASYLRVACYGAAVTLIESALDQIQDLRFDLGCRQRQKRRAGQWQWGIV